MAAPQVALARGLPDWGLLVKNRSFGYVYYGCWWGCASNRTIVRGHTDRCAGMERSACCARTRFPEGYAAVRRGLGTLGSPSLGRERDAGDTDAGRCAGQ